MKLEGSADAGGVGRCEYKGVGFEVPPGWADESIFKATAPSSGGSAQSTPSVIMTRRARLDGETVATHIEQQILELCRLPGFELIERTEGEVGGRRAIFVRYTWGEGVVVTQRAAFVEAPAQVGETQSAVATLTTTTAPGDAERMDPIFDRLLQSVVLAAPARASSAPPPSMVPPPPSMIPPHVDQPPEVPMPGTGRRYASSQPPSIPPSRIPPSGPRPSFIAPPGELPPDMPMPGTGRRRGY
jgi:hypothetical protein